MLRRRHLHRASLLFALTLAMLTGTVLGKRLFKNDQAAADSFQMKVDRIKANAAAAAPDRKPTKFSQEEINAYFAERRLKLPEGVKTVTFDLKPEQVSAFTRVDFEQIRKSRKSMNPLLAIFDGVHDCHVVASAQPAGPGMVHVRVESVEIDGMTVPRMALELFVKHYVNPKYPNVGLDNDYKLPARIDAAVIGDQVGTITQK